MQRGSERLQLPCAWLLPSPAVSHLASAGDGLGAIIYLCQTLLPAHTALSSSPPKTEAAKPGQAGSSSLSSHCASLSRGWLQGAGRQDLHHLPGSVLSGWVWLFWTQASFSLQGEMVLGSSSAKERCQGMFAETCRLQPAPLQAQTLLRFCSLGRRRRPSSTGHPKARPEKALLQLQLLHAGHSCLPPCSNTGCVLLKPSPISQGGHWAGTTGCTQQQCAVVGPAHTRPASPTHAASSQEQPGASTAAQLTPRA